MLHLHHRKLIKTGIIFLSAWLVGTFFIHYFERAQGWTYFEAFYFTVITTATVGFGDYIPHTMAGKILTMIYSVIFVPLFLYTMTVLFQANFQRIRQQDEALERTLHDIEADTNEILNETKKTIPKKRVLAKK